MSRRCLGLSLVGSLSLATGCGEPTANFQEPNTSGPMDTGSAETSTSATSNASSVTTGGGPITTSTSTDGSDSTTTMGGETEDFAGTTGEAELPDNACLVKDSYPDLGMSDDVLGFFVDFGTRSTGVDVFLTDSRIDPFDVIIVQLYENRAPFSDVPQPGIYDIEALGGLDACGGVCVSLNADSAFDDNAFVDPSFVLRATSGRLTITGLQWDPTEPTNGMVSGTLQDVVFEQVDPVNDELMPEGCTVSLEGVSFAAPVTSVIQP